MIPHAWFWAVWIFGSGVAFGALATAALWIAGSKELQRIRLLAMAQDDGDEDADEEAPDVPA